MMSIRSVGSSWPFPCGCCNSCRYACVVGGMKEDKQDTKGTEDTNDIPTEIALSLLKEFSLFLPPNMHLLHGYLYLYRRLEDLVFINWATLPSSLNKTKVLPVRNNE